MNKEINYLLKLFFGVLILLFWNNHLIDAKIFFINYSENDKFKLKVVENVKIYLNNKFQGLYIKQQQGILNVLSLSDGIMKINGSIYHYHKTMHENNLVSYLVDQFEECDFILNPNGIISIGVNSDFPPIQNIPYFPDKDIKEGEIYQITGKASVNLFNSQENNLFEIIITICYSGKKEWLGVLYDYFDISYGYSRILMTNEVKKARGRHNLKLFFNGSNGRPVFIIDHFIEEFDLKDNSVIKRDGFIDYFYDMIIPMDKDKTLNDLTSDTDKKILQDLTFTKKKEGISITINNLKFKPNSTELLDSEKNKLEEVYQMLAKIPKRSFMIIGHTALFGTVSEQMKLSEERAQTIANDLIKRGLPVERIYFCGKGATQPVAPNDTEENMQKNRRVEIIILED